VETADCFAVQRGKRQGWLTPEGLEEVCNFIRPSQPNSKRKITLTGAQRCEIMRRCYMDPSIR
jgi:hypothetical protein